MKRTNLCVAFAAAGMLMVIQTSSLWALTAELETDNYSAHSLSVQMRECQSGVNCPVVYNNPSVPPYTSVYGETTDPQGVPIIWTVAIHDNSTGRNCNLAAAATNAVYVTAKYNADGTCPPLQIQTLVSDPPIVTTTVNNLTSGLVLYRLWIGQDNHNLDQHDGSLGPQQSQQYQDQLNDYHLMGVAVSFHDINWFVLASCSQSFTPVSDRITATVDYYGLHNCTVTIH